MDVSSTTHGHVANRQFIKNTLSVPDSLVGSLFNPQRLSPRVWPTMLLISRIYRVHVDEGQRPRSVPHPDAREIMR